MINVLLEHFNVLFVVEALVELVLVTATLTLLLMRACFAQTDRGGSEASFAGLTDLIQRGVCLLCTLYPLQLCGDHC